MDSCAQSRSLYESRSTRVALFIYHFRHDGNKRVFICLQQLLVCVGRNDACESPAAPIADAKFELMLSKVVLENIFLRLDYPDANLGFLDPRGFR